MSNAGEMIGRLCVIPSLCIIQRLGLQTIYARYMKRILSVIFSVFLFFAATAQERIKWISMQEAIDKNKTEPRKIVVDVYTDWCGWCKRMDATTFVSPDVVSFINANYWAVKFDAEGNDKVTYKGQEYINLPPVVTSDGRSKKNTHPLAVKLLNGRMSYPSLVYLDDSSNVIAPVGGYRDANGLMPFLVYFAENLHQYADLQQFTDDFAKAYGGPVPVDSLRVHWLDVEVAFERAEKEDKKVFLFFYSDWSVPSHLMEQVSFEDSLIAKFINTNYLPVRFNVTSSDTVKLREHSFANQKKDHPYHDFAVSILNGDMKMPTMVFLTPQAELITRTQGYFTRKTVEPVLHYFSNETFKTVPWETYRAQFTSVIK